MPSLRIATMAFLDVELKGETLIKKGINPAFISPTSPSFLNPGSTNRSDIINMVVDIYSGDPKATGGPEDNKKLITKVCENKTRPVPPLHSPRESQFRLSLAEVMNCWPHVRESNYAHGTCVASRRAVARNCGESGEEAGSEPLYRWIQCAKYRRDRRWRFVERKLFFHHVVPLKQGWAEAKGQSRKV